MGIPVVDKFEVGAYYGINNLVDTLYGKISRKSTSENRTKSGGLERVLSSDSNSVQNIQNLDSQVKEESQLISNSVKYLGLIIGAYFTYQKTRELFSSVENSNNEQQQQQSSQTGSSSQNNSMFGGLVGNVLKFTAGAYVANELFQRFNTFADYYATHLHEYGMEEQHMRDIAYILTFGEEVPHGGYRGNNMAYNQMYNMLQRVGFHKLDNTPTGKRIIMGLATFGREVAEKVGEEGGGMVFEKMKKMNKKSSKPA
ncbi:MAG: hypothetical protein LAT82_04225 [Nanoarchaeota archaeon]|nr:hypothetical protein [Nanoarchaeota archaeon]